MSLCVGKCQVLFLAHRRCSINAGSLCFSSSWFKCNRKVTFIFFFELFLLFPKVFSSRSVTLQSDKEMQCKEAQWALCLWRLSQCWTVRYQCSTLKALRTARGSSFVSRCTSEGQVRWTNGSSWFLCDCRTTTHKPSTSKTWNKRHDFSRQ